jgi:hypothetical protein
MKSLELLQGWDHSDANNTSTSSSQNSSQIPKNPSENAPKNENKKRS